MMLNQNYEEKKSDFYCDDDEVKSANSNLTLRGLMNLPNSNVF